MVTFLDLFKPKWRHSDREKRLQAVSRIQDIRKLHRIADESDDDRVRLAAAARLADGRRIKAIARSSADDSVRLQAALAVKDQSCLAAIALNAWSIQRGLKAVERIGNRLLLRRIARSAKQDAIRLAAAVKLDHPGLLRQVARNSSLVDIHWQVARRLNDPQMLAEISYFKPFNSRMAPLRRKAKKALIAHLDQCRRNRDHGALLSVMASVPQVTVKLEAFFRLAPEAVTSPTLHLLSRQDFRYIPHDLIDKVIATISAGGWQVTTAHRHCPCIHCKASGRLSLKCISVNRTWNDRDAFPCPECGGRGQVACKRVICRRRDDEAVVFRFPG